MIIEMRELETSDEIDTCLKLQRDVWGLSDLGKTSPITLSSLTITEPRLGFLLGWYLEGTMVACSIIMGTLEKGTVFGRMFGILPEYRNRHIGRTIHSILFPYLCSKGVTTMVWAYEPLEGRNANLYLNLSGGVVYRYLPDFYQDVDRMSSGMPADRFLVRSRIGSENTKKALQETPPRIGKEDALHHYPMATVDRFPDSPKVLVRIPGELQDLKTKSPERALRYRMETRAIFQEYLNERRYICRTLITGVHNNQRENFYLLEKEDPA